MSTNTTHADAKTVDALTAIDKGQRVHHNTLKSLVQRGLVEDGKLTTKGEYVASHDGQHPTIGQELAIELDAERERLQAERIAAEDAGVVPVKPKRSRKMRPCTCGCGGMTGGGKFLPGHDARWAGEVGRAAGQTLALSATEADALAAVADLQDSHDEVSDALLAKAARIAVATRAKIGVPKPAKA